MCLQIAPHWMRRARTILPREVGREPQSGRANPRQLSAFEPCEAPVVGASVTTLSGLARGPSALFSKRGIYLSTTTSSAVACSRFVARTRAARLSVHFAAQRANTLDWARAHSLEPFFQSSARAWKGRPRDAPTFRAHCSRRIAPNAQAKIRMGHGVPAALCMVMNLAKLGTDIT
jgi:hypothetical protein